MPTRGRPAEATIAGYATHWRGAIIALLAALCFGAPAARAACTVWHGPTPGGPTSNGNWNTAGNWSPGIVPNSSGTDICIDGGNAAAASAVTLDINATTQNLTIDADDSLAVQHTLNVDGTLTSNGGLSIGGGSRLNLGSAGNTLGGTVSISSGGQIAVGDGAALSLEHSGIFTNSGNIGLNAASGTSDLVLTGGSPGRPVTLGGGGTVTLSNNVNNRIFSNDTTGLVIGQNQTVQGAGQIGLGKTTITNNGTIIANQSAD
jgi:hypothetical protein